jgi:hypothetical protein
MCIMAFGNSLLRIDGAGVPPPIRHTAMCYGAAAADAVRHGFLLDSIERCAPVASSNRSTRLRVSTHGQTSGPPGGSRRCKECVASLRLAIAAFRPGLAAAAVKVETGVRRERGTPSTTLSGPGGRRTPSRDRSSENEYPCDYYRVPL